MRRRAAMRQARGQGGAARAREIDVPLPLNGLFADAKSSEISGLYAARLENWRPNGASIEIVPSYSLNDERTRRRVPYEFGLSSVYITLGSVNVEADGASFTRKMAENASVGYISAQAIMADGQSLPLRFNGSTIEECAYTTTTGVDAGIFDGVLVHHDRPYFWQHEGTLEFYYGGVGAVQGELTRFPLSRLGNITGQIASLVSLTQDASENLNDSLCVLTTTGQIVIYEGTNPGDASDWRLAGRVKAAPPVGRFSFVNVGGDVWMLTRSGLVSVLESLRRGQLALVGNLARPISDDIRALVATGGEWQLHTSAQGEYVIANHYLDGVSRQFIYDVEAQAWETADYPARRWHNLAGNTEFTTADGRLGRLGEGTVTRTAEWWSSWFRVPRAAEIKYLTPTILGTGPVTVTVAVLSDHNKTAADIAEATQTVTLDPEDPADPGGIVSMSDPIAIDAVGEVFQIRMSVQAAQAEIVNVKAGIA